MARYSERKSAAELLEMWSVKRKTIEPRDYEFYKARSVEILAYSAGMGLNPSFSIQYQSSRDVFTKLVRERSVKNSIQLERNTIYLDLAGNAFLSSATAHLFFAHGDVLTYALNMLSASIINMRPTIDSKNVRFFAPNLSVIQIANGAWIKGTFPDVHKKLMDALSEPGNNCYSQIRAALKESYVTDGSAYRMKSVFQKMSQIDGLDPHEVGYHSDHDRHLLTITRFMLGHEFGHFLYNLKHEYCKKIMLIMDSVLPNRDRHLDAELFADIIAFEYLIFHAGRERLSLRMTSHDIVTAFIMLSILDVYNLRNRDASGSRGKFSTHPRYEIMLRQIQEAGIDPDLTMRYSISNVYESALRFWLFFIPVISEILSVIRELIPTAANGVPRKLLRFELAIHDANAHRRKSP